MVLGFDLPSLDGAEPIDSLEQERALVDEPDYGLAIARRSGADQYRSLIILDRPRHDFRGRGRSRCGALDCSSRSRHKAGGYRSCHVPNRRGSVRSSRRAPRRSFPATGRNWNMTNKLEIARPRQFGLRRLCGASPREPAHRRRHSVKGLRDGLRCRSRPKPVRSRLDTASCICRHPRRNPGRRR